MADLNPLIRVRKHVVEQKQKFLAELYRQAEELENQKATLLGQLKEERKKVDEMGAQMLSYFGAYSDSVKARIKDIDDAVAKLEMRIQIAQDDMRAAFAELKKIEIIQDRRKSEEKAAIDKKESEELDAIAIEGFRRKAEEEV